MISSKMNASLNNQIQCELYSSNLYLAMSAWSEGQNLKGFAHWLKMQADEERTHALKIFDYLLDVGNNATVPALEQPPSDFSSPQKLFEEVYNHEKKITALIHKLCQQALDEKDFRTQIFLQWFVTEQIEEESNAQEILQKLTAIGDKSTGVYWLDKELKKR